jgi:hypothetical protein
MLATRAKPAFDLVFDARGRGVAPAALRLPPKPPKQQKKIATAATTKSALMPMLVRLSTAGDGDGDALRGAGAGSVYGGGGGRGIGTNSDCGGVAGAGEGGGGRGHWGGGANEEVVKSGAIDRFVMATVVSLRTHLGYSASQPPSSHERSSVVQSDATSTRPFVTAS